MHEMDTAQFDLELVEHQDYAVQTLSQTLWIPPACIPSMDISTGRLVNVGYQVRLRVDVEPDAVYRHADNQHTTDTMAVDVPLIIYAKGNIAAAAPSPSASTDTQLSQPTSPPPPSSGRLRNSVNLGNNGKMRERFKSMFKKRDSTRLNASATIDTTNNTSKLSSTTSLRGAFGSLKIKSSNNINNDNRTSSINTTTPSSSVNSSAAGSLSPPHSSSLPPKAFSNLPLSSSPPSPPPPPPPQLSFSIPEAISSQDDTTPAIPPSLPILRSLSIKHPSSAERSTLQVMTSTTTTTEPVPPIPLVEGGGVYTFHIFADSSDEEDNVGEESKIQGTQASSLSRSGSFPSSVGKQGSLDTTSYNQYNEQQEEEDDKRDVDGSDTEDTQIYTVSSSGIGKLDQVSESSDDDEAPGENSSEEEDDNDLLSLLAKRERRIERKKERGSPSSRQRR